MGTEIIEGVFFNALKPIITTGGSVMHAIKGMDEHIPAISECYFSTADNNLPKAWKKHSEMICNIFVPSGGVRFVFYDDRPTSKDYGKIKEFELSRSNYGRLIIHPGIWFGFSGIGEQGGEAIILNVSNILHSPEESIRLEPGNETIPYTWSF